MSIRLLENSWECPFAGPNVRNTCIYSTYVFPLYGGKLAMWTMFTFRRRRLVHLVQSVTSALFVSEIVLGNVNNAVLYGCGSSGTWKWYCFIVMWCSVVLVVCVRETYHRQAKKLIMLLLFLFNPVFISCYMVRLHFAKSWWHDPTIVHIGLVCKVLKIFALWNTFGIIWNSLLTKYQYVYNKVQ